jgi:dTDP-4-dehydrorhamnose reductase
VIGASGQLGGQLLTQLRTEGHPVVGTYASFPIEGLTELDVADERAVGQLLVDVAPELVLLAAGWTWVDGNEDDPERARQTNFEQPLAIARRCREIGARFVTYSTDYVFDGAAGPYAETDPPRPLSVYGRAKLDAERAILGEMPEHLVVRTTTVFGPEDQGKNFVYQLLRRVAAGERMVVPSDQRSTPSYGPDVARATLALVNRGASGVWHVSGPDFLDRVALARLACRVFGLDESLVEGRPTAELQQKAARPLRGGLSTDKLRAAGIALRGTEEALHDLREQIAAGRAAPVRTMLS